MELTVHVEGILYLVANKPATLDPHSLSGSFFILKKLLTTVRHYTIILFMMKTFFYMPLHLLNLYLAVLSPRWLFKSTYQMSSDVVRESEQQIRNKARLAAYYSKRFISK